MTSAVAPHPFVDLADELKKFHLKAPIFSFLTPNSSSYKGLFYQPEGKIEVGNTFVRRFNRTLAESECAAFLELATSSKADLAVAPEYSCPFEILFSALSRKLIPDLGKLWVVGCEAVTSTDINGLQNRLGDDFVVCFDPEIAQQAGEFLNAAFLVFQTVNEEDVQKIAIVIQFKTHPMADPAHFENVHMKKGKKIYVFNKNDATQLKLAILICSDALSPSCQNQILFSNIHGRSIIVHIQLNPDPRNTTFRAYREHCYGYTGGEETDVFCVNWSKNVSSDPPALIGWKNISGSAIYTKANHVEGYVGAEAKELANHSKGLYATFWDDRKTYCFFFNYDPGIYHFSTTKPWQGNIPFQEARKLGPSMVSKYIWNTQGNWQPATAEPDDEFRSACSAANNAGLRLLYAPTYHPVDAERLLNISLGNAVTERWHQIKEMATFRVDSSEVIGRITFAQDPNASSKDARQRHLVNFGHLLDIAKDRTLWPAWLKKFSNNAFFKYESSKPYVNFHEGKESATLIYGGDSPRLERLEEIYRKSKDLLLARSIDLADRLTIWIRGSKGLELYPPGERPKTNRSNVEGPLDIDREDQSA